MKKVLVLGGGTAGTIVANRFRKAYPASKLAVTVVDQDNDHHYQPGYLFLPFGQLSEQQVVRPRDRQLRRGITFVQSGIERVLPEDKRVLLANGQSLDYDVLIIATGVSPRPDQTPGMDDQQEYGVSIHEFFTLAGAKRLADALRQWPGGRMVVHITEMPIKCPVAPLEFAFLVDDYLDQHGLRRATELSFVTPLDGAFTKPVAKQELGESFVKRGIHLVTDFMVERVDAKAHKLVAYDGTEVPYDMLVTIPINMGADYVARSGLGDELNLVPNDPATLVADGHPDIFVLGDAGTIPTSKAGAVAHFSIDIFMENFEQYLAGKPMTHRFDGHANCFIESGRGKAMLLDFNYDVEPLTGAYPFPVVGPLTLLKESRVDHWGKLGFRWIYWHLLIPGRWLPLPSKMTMLGKKPPKSAN